MLCPADASETVTIGFNSKSAELVGTEVPV